MTMSIYLDLSDIIMDSGNIALQTSPFHYIAKYDTLREGTSMICKYQSPFLLHCARIKQRYQNM